jgi:carbon-monoxide dehydrogenase medium subunit
LKRLGDFTYHEPVSLDEAIADLAAAGGGGRVIAGGTDLIVDMKMGRMTPSVVVNIKGIPDLAGIEDTDGGIRIGALTKVTLVGESTLIAARHPAISQAASILASPPVRALATVGGNVGRASPASDLGPALIVSKAVASVVGSDGARDYLVEDLYAGPGATILGDTDIITSFFIPNPPIRFGSAHAKVGKRGSGTDIAVAGVAASIELSEEGNVIDCVIALASLGPTPMRAQTAEAVLRGKTISAELIASAARATGSDARPIGDMRASAGYRTTLAEVLARRVLTAAVASAGAEVTA